MNQYSCDICGKKTEISPEVEYLYEDVNTEVTGVVDGKVFKNTVTHKVPKLDPKTNTPMFIDKTPRAFVVRVSVGFEHVQKDFCRECLDKQMKDIKKLWDKLKAIGDK